ncbi:hypothetical protein H310_12201 [Aphanomyces invadans]|uniref:Uncharacterized protein n=1 Tax=Aphanomyces invadans TaxID=157072 RepID=A0A024TIM8_9STRA|nr:hypothetical protein H310_12201 [Aphanomyces invadans]ETV93849.1 hypothetical protein H310_12201 [Aphanomyces invadans]|eukprot:XP_008877409.1 hypothetical protein H310_12201 [Aphanomyces invadans]
MGSVKNLPPDHHTDPCRPPRHTLRLRRAASKRPSRFSSPRPRRTSSTRRSTAARFPPKRDPPWVSPHITLTSTSPISQHPSGVAAVVCANSHIPNASNSSKLRGWLWQRLLRTVAKPSISASREPPHEKKKSASERLRPKWTLSRNVIGGKAATTARGLRK